MSSEMKLDAVICHDGSEREFNSDGKRFIIDRPNGMHSVQDNFRSQEEWSNSNLPTAECKSSSERCLILSLFLVRIASYESTESNKFLLLNLKVISTTRKDVLCT